MRVEDHAAVDLQVGRGRHGRDERWPRGTGGGGLEVHIRRVRLVTGWRGSLEWWRDVEVEEGVFVAFPAERDGVVDHAFLSYRMFVSRNLRLV